jgi:ATPase subunit of ABC transporter with duplicated ATPase domains
LLQKPDILLLDEPTNHLDAESVAWLEHHLQNYAGTIIAVTHDRYFLDNVAGWILELDRGEGIPWKGNYSSWLDQKQERLRREEKSESERQTRSASWNGFACAESLPGEREGASTRTRVCWTNSPVRREDPRFPAGPRLGDVVIEVIT